MVNGENFGNRTCGKRQGKALETILKGGTTGATIPFFGSALGYAYGIAKAMYDYQECSEKGLCFGSVCQDKDDPTVTDIALTYMSCWSAGYEHAYEHCNSGKAIRAIIQCHDEGLKHLFHQDHEEEIKEKSADSARPE